MKKPVDERTHLLSRNRARLIVEKRFNKKNNGKEFEALFQLGEKLRKNFKPFATPFYEDKEFEAFSIDG